MDYCLFVCCRSVQIAQRTCHVPQYAQSLLPSQRDGTCFELVQRPLARPLAREEKTIVEAAASHEGRDQALKTSLKTEAEDRQDGEELRSCDPAILIPIDNERILTSMRSLTRQRSSAIAHRHRGFDVFDGWLYH